jgi:hypothetical protein
MKLGFANMYVANSNGRGGMLLMFSSQHVRLSLKYLHTNYIDVLVMGDDPSKDWRLTGLYGESVWRHKHQAWSWLRDLHGQVNYPWLVIGDMNEILYNTEKEGGQPRPQRYMQAFRDCLADCSLQDLGYTKDIFTWHRGGVRERLDRAVGNADWSNLYPHAAVHHYIFWFRSSTNYGGYRNICSGYGEVSW